MKYTPGPWKQNPIAATAIFGSNGKRVADIAFNHGGYNEDKIADTDHWSGNAQLISAAPELLEALKEMVKKYSPNLKGLGIVSDPRSVEMALEAIRKAEGN